MKLAEIPFVKAGSSIRKTVADFDGLAQERMSLATRAADLLGYQGLAAEMTGGIAITRPGKLAETLNALDIEVLDLGSVLDYQMQEMIRVTREKIEQDNLDDWATGYWVDAGWGKTPLSDYRQPIPEFVLETAIRIREKLPEVKFHVQHLHDPKADPFLVASMGKEIYYVAAWDEPRFEGRLSR